jgi:putative transposase
MNDNTHMESFFRSMKCEQLYGKIFEAKQQLRGTLSSYIRFYNERRLHSSLRYLPPATYENSENGEVGVN